MDPAPDPDAAAALARWLDESRAACAWLGFAPLPTEQLLRLVIPWPSGARPVLQ